MKEKAIKVWNIGLDRGQELFGDLPMEVLREAHVATESERLSCYRSMQAVKDELTLGTFKADCGRWWKVLKARLCVGNEPVHSLLRLGESEK